MSSTSPRRGSLSCFLIGSTFLSVAAATRTVYVRSAGKLHEIVQRKKNFIPPGGLRRPAAFCIVILQKRSGGGKRVDKDSVRAFFDACAPTWDAGMVRSERVIGTILDGARVGAGKTVLDVACGTGVLFPDYLARGVSHVTAIDISPAMADIARSKAAGKPITVLCGDVESYAFGGTFDCVVVYNAFPHFPDSARILAVLARLVSPGGTLTIAHGMSREKLAHHHSGAASAVSIGLPELDALAALLPAELTPLVRISDDTMYQLTAVKKP